MLTRRQAARESHSQQAVSHSGRLVKGSLTGGKEEGTICDEIQPKSNGTFLVTITRACFLTFSIISSTTTRVGTCSSQPPTQPDLLTYASFPVLYRSTLYF